MESPSSTERRLIRSNWHDYKSGPDGYLLPGWSCKEFDMKSFIKYSPALNERFRLPINIPKYCYTHSSSTDEMQSQWYPVPVLPSNSNPSPQPQTVFISARTSRAHLCVGDRTCSGSRAATPPPIQILNAQRQIIGTLQLNNEDEVNRFAESNTSLSIEFVATSKGYTGRIFDEELAKTKVGETGETWEPQLKDCYFVLWIEWENEVAYRRGDGVVTVEAWEEAREEELVELILG
jgi:hypothetical protein